ncbi:AI-2E family transporter [Longimonas halophila]|uniref:AI-2E family transporter n=1 Tax=Longimonas halophila TaxID=1469170 RepID=A0A2H3NMT3_9BACT|nr:AI-2E family transporter [Longimonas halophila]PEN07914.1 AI-2E family transporter [Longimonas halophila]
MTPPDTNDLAESWRDAPVHEVLLLLGGLVMLLALLYTMEFPQYGSFLSPPVVAVAGGLLLWPVHQNAAARALVLAGGVLLLIWAIARTSTVLIPFVAVYLLAYLLHPIVKRLDHSYRVPRWVSSLVVTVLVVGLFITAIVIIAPNIAEQVDRLSRQMLSALETLRDWLATSPVVAELEGAGVIERDTLIRELTDFVQQQTRRLPSAAEQVLASVGSVLGVITVLALIPVILFYTLKDYPSIRDSLVGLFPTANGRRDYIVEAGGIVGNYLRGQLIISLISGVNVAVALALFGVPFWLLIGLLVGIMNFVPRLGPIVGMVLGGCIGLLFGGWMDAVIVLAVILAQQLLEQSVLTPKILSYQMGLHPVLIVFALLAFGTFMGIFGLLIAVPATAILVTIYRAWREELTLELNEYGQTQRR